MEAATTWISVSSFGASSSTSSCASSSTEKPQTLNESIELQRNSVSGRDCSYLGPHGAAEMKLASKTLVLQRRL